MIVSHKHQYVFVQFPHTACTAVGRELVDLYDGEPILFKHAAYHDYLRVADERMAAYFAFSSIRNPLDELVSFYFKLKTNHNGDFTNPEKLKSNGGWITPRIIRRYEYVRDSDADFFDYLRRFYKMPHVNWSVLDHRSLDFVMRYETIQNDFSRVLESIGLTQQRPLPLVNPTNKPETRLILEEASDDQRRLLQWVAGPLMQYWGYGPSRDEDGCSESIVRKAAFRLMCAVKSTYWRHLRHRL